jgi:hypothetical protein
MTKKSKLQRRREMACIAYQGTMKEGAGGLYCGEIYLEDINKKLEEEGLPPFVNDGEMMQAIREQLDHRANAIQRTLVLMGKEGVDRLDDLHRGKP